MQALKLRAIACVLVAALVLVRQFRFQDDYLEGFDLEARRTGHPPAAALHHSCSGSTCTLAVRALTNSVLYARIESAATVIAPSRIAPCSPGGAVSGNAELATQCVRYAPAEDGMHTIHVRPLVEHAPPPPPPPLPVCRLTAALPPPPPPCRRRLAAAANARFHPCANRATAGSRRCPPTGPRGIHERGRRAARFPAGPSQPHLRGPPRDRFAVSDVGRLVAHRRRPRTCTRRHWQWRQWCCDQWHGLVSGGRGRAAGLQRPG